jgi:large subunit ribosomal protein L13
MIEKEKKKEQEKKEPLMTPGLLKTIFPKKEFHVPKWFVIDATDKTLGRLSTEASKLLRGKETSLFTPGIDQGNFVVILNSHKIQISGKKESQKLYYRNSQRPGSLKIETFKQLKERIPSRILEKAIWGMLPKGVLGREYYRRLFVYQTDKIPYRKETNQKTNEQEKKIYGSPKKFISLEMEKQENWIRINID